MDSSRVQTPVGKLSLRAATLVPKAAVLGGPGHSESSLAALGHMSEELVTLLIAETLQAVRALEVTLTSLGCAGAPALCTGLQLLGTRPRPPVTRHHTLQPVAL
jgi:hypothetical protein